MRLDYMAHSCFLLEHGGFRVLFDPYDPSIGYPSPKLYDVDLIIVSHDHQDHNAVSTISGPAVVARGVARRSYGPLTLHGSVGRHGEGDDADFVSLTCLEWAGKKIAHFGDLGCDLTPPQVELFQSLDLLLIPCGGGYTIDGERAAAVVSELKPKIVVPMHYQTPFLDRTKFLDFQTAEPFLNKTQSFAPSRVCKQGWSDLDSIWAEGSDSTLVLHLQHQMA